MGSTSSAASSLSNPITFTGQSTYSSSFQQVLQRAVSIASLPMQQLEGEIGTLENQQTDLSNMQSTFSSLQSAVQSISSAMTGDISATSSDSSVVSVSAQSTTLPGTYSIQVSNIGSSTTTISNAGSPAVTDPSSQNISASSSFTLTVNGVATTITPSGDTLDDLANAINDSSTGVSATIVNLGSNNSPDYRLTLTSTELGPDTIQLNDGTSDLLSTVQTGADAQYTVNGNSTVLTSNSDQVTLAPGLTATLLNSAPGQNVTITVAASESNLASALSSFATAYNSAVSAVTSETGQNGGALAGQSVVYELQDALSQIAQFITPTGSVQSLSDLGLDLSDTGTLTFDQSQFDSLSATGIQQFLGGLTSGGFLQTANNVLSSIAGQQTGMLTTEFNNVASEITTDQGQVSNDQNLVNTIETNLQQQLSAADAAIAVLQEQNTYYANLMQTENANNFAGLG
ncbi:MAG TPA: flagellar filament capping protein FliD [Bryobacteraceae bacterium]|nr:flagellar filament capping protein FliD [Bryobacteraceae bacterium]